MPMRECVRFIAPPASDSAGGTMGERCGVHISAPTHNRLKVKPIRVMLMQQNRCLPTPVLLDLRLPMLGGGALIPMGGESYARGTP